MKRFKKLLKIIKKEKRKLSQKCDNHLYQLESEEYV